MAFIGVLLFMFPFLAAFAGIVIFLCIVIGFCLLAIGISGIIMEKLRTKLTGVPQRGWKKVLHITSLVMGAAVILFPLGATMYSVIEAVIGK